MKSFSAACVWLPMSVASVTVKSPSLPLWKKGLAVLAVLYVLSPVDVIPDVVPVLGWLDDLGVITAAVTTLLSGLKLQRARPRHGVEIVDAEVS